MLKKVNDIKLQSGKKQRKAITLEKKYEIITNHKTGSSVKDLCIKYSLSSSTVCTILKDKEKYLNEVKNAKSMQSTWLRSKEINSIVPHMEKLLTAWINEQTDQTQGTISYATICAKALSIFRMLKNQRGDSCKETFVASSGWYTRYKKRAGWYNAKTQSEHVNVAIENPNLFSNKLIENIEKNNQISPEDKFQIKKQKSDKKSLLENQLQDSFPISETTKIKNLTDNECCESMSTSDVNDLLEAHNVNITTEDLVKIENKIKEEIPDQIPSLKEFQIAFWHLEKAIKIFQSQDNDIERSNRVALHIREATTCYRKILNEKKTSHELTAYNNLFRKKYISVPKV